MRARSASRFVVYDGEHNWMPKDFAERALAWLQLRAMVKGIAPVDKEFIAQEFESRLAEAGPTQKSGDILAAERAYREIAQDFSSFRDVKPQMALAKSLAESGEFRKARRMKRRFWTCRMRSPERSATWLRGSPRARSAD